MNTRLILGILLLITACASRGPSGEEPPQSPVPQPAPAAQTPVPVEEADMVELEGTLAPTVEAGGWVVETEDGTFLLLSIESYRREAWFREGTRVKVTGKPSPDTVSIFMQGMPFQVKSMEPAREP